MIATINGLLIVSGLVLLVLVGIIATQALASWLLPSQRRPHQSATEEPSVVILMPAHNEADIIGPMVTSTLARLPHRGRLLVIADNCSDDTATAARAAGAEVTERHDTSRRGKGYALAHGAATLAANPPDVVIVLDADCEVAADSLSLLAAEAHRLQRPVQGMYDMHAPTGAGLVQRMAAFAWDFRTRLRAEGYRRLGLPCQLLGSGMAFPWPLLARVELATGHIVEDLKLGLDCATQGSAPRFYPAATVFSTFPRNQQGEKSQRERWEHGHMSMVVSEAPRLLWRSFRTGNGSLLALTIDMCVPPLALLGLLLVVQAASTGLLILAGLARIELVWLSGCLLALFALTILLGWWRAGRRWVKLSELVFAPWYVLRKLPMYLKFLTRRQLSWIRTRRD